MKRVALSFASMLALALVLAPVAQASFGFSRFDFAFEDAGGSPAMQAGSHPFSVSNVLGVNETDDFTPEGAVKDLRVSLPPGVVGDPTATPRCRASQFYDINEVNQHSSCPDSSAIGVATVKIGFAGPTTVTDPIYNLVPPPGALVRLGFVVSVGGVPVTLDLHLNHDPPYNVIATANGVSQAILYYGSTVTLWGNPESPAHDEQRGYCVDEVDKSCPSDAPEKPLLTMPTSCEGPLRFSIEADSWEDPGAWTEPVYSETHDDAEPPNPLGVTGCERLAFNPTIDAKPTSRAAQSPTGLDLSLNVGDEGIGAPEGLANSTIRKAVVTLPEGMTANPSLAEGLGVCTEVDLARETPSSAPGEGCPEAAKVGTVEVESPLLEGQLLQGTLYIAKPYDNLAGNSFIALYIVIKDSELGILVKQPLRVEPDSRTGRLVTVAEEIPQLPFSHLRLRFREGGRAPLISPPGCGTFDTEATLYPWAGGAPVTTSSAFQIVSGPGEGPCPTGAAPFHPGFEAGSESASAGAYSPFYMRIARGDGEQDMSKLSAVLPPGLLGRLADLGRCPDADIAAAKAKTGLAERAKPSCPASSQIGRTLAGAGVGNQLTYVPGSLYLAGPYHGDPLSVVAIVPAVAGPFDAGTVVVREALTLNPSTAQVEVDGAASDPIPHILKGIPLNVRDLEVYADRPEFTLNPTSCRPQSTLATLWGGGTALAPTGETPIELPAPYTAVNCAKLPFSPKLSLTLRGGTKRGKFPKLRGIYSPHTGDADLSRLVLTLPHSAFLEQGHFGTICTRVQYTAAGGDGAGCPAASVYGSIRAWTPLLEEPLEGPVFLRSSNHNLPDLVASLRGLVDVEVVAQIDSAHGGIRATFANLPDAPLYKAIVDMRGGKKGLIVNSTDLCAVKQRAQVAYTAQSGRRAEGKPLVRAASCKRHPSDER